MAKCKECGGNNAKKLSVIEKLGTQTGRAKGSGVGMTGAGVGVGFHCTSINTKSDIAREAGHHNVHIRTRAQIAYLTQKSSAQSATDNSPPTSL